MCFANRRIAHSPIRPCFLAMLALLACSSVTTEPLPLAITISADKLATTVGDSILFDVQAQGGVLVGVGVDYGDGQGYGVETQGARTARARLRHAYAQPGVYGVSATVTDAAAGQKSAALTVTIR